MISLTVLCLCVQQVISIDINNGNRHRGKQIFDSKVIAIIMEFGFRNVFIYYIDISESSLIVDEG